MKRRLLKISLILLVLGVGIALGANTALQYFADRYTPTLERVLSKQLGIPVTLGAMRAEIFPYPRLTARKVILEQEHPALPIEVDSLSVVPSVRALLARHIKLRSIEIKIQEHSITAPFGHFNVHEIDLHALLDIGEGKAALRDITVTATVNQLPVSLSVKSAVLEGETQVLSVQEANVIQGSNRFAFSASFERGRVLRIESTFVLKAFKLVDGSDKYEAEEAKGDLEIHSSSDERIVIAGEAVVRGFGFSDTTTALKNVNAELNAIRIILYSPGNVTASVQVNGDQLNLLAPNIEIVAIEEVSAPLEISVPAAGGYEVRGPVNLAGASMILAESSFEKVTGQVGMFVSGPRKEFSSDEIIFVKDKLSGHLATDLIMLPAEYRLSSAQTDYLGGSLRLKGMLARSNKRSMRVEADASQLEITRIASLLRFDPNLISQGTVEKFKLLLEGDKEALPQSLTGMGEIFITQPKARSAKITKLLASALHEVAVIGEIFRSEKMERSEDDQRFSAKFHLADSSCIFEEAQLERASYSVETTGTLGFDKTLNLKGKVIMLEKAISSFGLGIEPLKFLLTRAGRVAIPITIQGALPEPKIKADLKTFVKDTSGIGFGENLIKGVKSVVTGEKSKASDIHHRGSQRYTEEEN